VRGLERHKPRPRGRRLCHGTSGSPATQVHDARREQRETDADNPSVWKPTQQITYTAAISNRDSSKYYSISPTVQQFRCNQALNKSGLEYIDSRRDVITQKMFQEVKDPKHKLHSNLLNNKGLDASYKLLKHSIRYA